MIDETSPCMFIAVIGWNERHWSPTSTLFHYHSVKFLHYQLIFISVQEDKQMGKGLWHTARQRYFIRAVDVGDSLNDSMETVSGCVQGK